MITYHCYDKGTLSHQVATELETLPGNVVWIDLLSPTAEEERFIEAALGLDIPTREELAEIEDSSRFYTEGHALFMTATVVSGIDKKRPSATPVTFVLTARQLITVRYGELSSFNQFVAKSARQPEVFRSSGRTFIALADAVVDRIADVLETLQAQLNQLSMRIFHDDGEHADLLKVLKQLGQHRTLLAHLGESLFSANRLLLYYREHFDENRGGPAAHWTRSLERDVRSLGEHQTKLLADVAFLLDACLGLINIEQSGTIKVFSIAAVLFLPPTLVGTIYGMNFEYMPELDWLLGYPMALVMMVVSAIIPYAWFKYRGWL